MRVLVGCSSCQRRYDASDRSPGSRFRCHCGEVIVVRQVEGHEAAVVRCGNCGAPRATGAASCVHCGIDFADRDLVRNTICPSCMTRCGDEARFCHHCGGTLSSESVQATASELPCPVCGDGTTLEHHQLGSGPAVLECPGCAGLWLEHSKIAELVAQAREQSLQRAPGSGGAPGPATIKPQNGPMYRQCPTCAAMMNRRNYGKVSGVVVDICKQHGIWFDADELPAIIRWIEAGGLERTAQLRAEEAERAKRQARDRPVVGGGGLGDRERHRGGFGRGGFDTGPDLDDIGELVVDGIGSAIGALARLFRRG